MVFNGRADSVLRNRVCQKWKPQGFRPRFYGHGVMSLRCFWEHCLFFFLHGGFYDGSVICSNCGGMGRELDAPKGASSHPTKSMPNQRLIMMIQRVSIIHPQRTIITRHRPRVM